MSSNRSSDSSYPVITARNITKIFKDRSKIREKYANQNFVIKWFKKLLSDKKKKALDDVSFELQEGEVLGLLGPNGAGKTTLMKVLTGLMEPDEGEVTVLGHEIPEEMKQIRPRIDGIFARANMFRHLSSYRNLKLFTEIYGEEVSEEGIDRYMEELNVKDRKNAYVDRLSTGERTKINLIKVFLTDPELVFLDEPTSGLDPYMAVKVREKIEEMNSEDVSILLTTHQMEEADYLCDRIIMIDEGKIIKKGKPGELKKEIKEDTIIEFRMRKFDTDTLEELEEEKEVEDVRYIPEEEKIRVILASEEYADEVIGEVRDLDLGIKKINFDEPTLEDVFIHLTGRELG